MACDVNLAKSNWRVSEIKSRTFACHEDFDDVTYSANIMLLMHVTPGGLSLQRCILSMQIPREPFVKLTFQAIF